MSEDKNLDGLVTVTHVMYGLHAFSALTGLMSTAFIVTAFLTGWPSIIAIIINYAKRDEESRHHESGRHKAGQRAEGMQPVHHVGDRHQPIQILFFTHAFNPGQIRIAV